MANVQFPIIQRSPVQRQCSGQALRDEARTNTVLRSKGDPEEIRAGNLDGRLTKGALQQRRGLYK